MLNLVTMLAGAALLGAGALVLSFHRPRVLRQGVPGPWCRRCGYSLFDRPERRGACPECGADLAVHPPHLPHELRHRCLIAQSVCWTTGIILLTMAVAVSLIAIVPRRETLRLHAQFTSPRSAAYRALELEASSAAWVQPGAKRPAAPVTVFRLTLVPLQGAPSVLRYEPRLPRVERPYPYGSAARRDQRLTPDDLLDWLRQSGVADSEELATEAVFVHLWINALAPRGQGSPNAGAGTVFSDVPTVTRVSSRPSTPQYLAAAAVLALLLSAAGIRRIRRRHAEPREPPRPDSVTPPE